MYFHVKGKGNENVKGLTKGQAVEYTASHSNKRVCAENVRPIAGVFVFVRSCAFKGERVGDSRALSHKVFISCPISKFIHPL